jgi:hypothetical protein
MSLAGSGKAKLPAAAVRPRLLVGWIQSQCLAIEHQPIIRVVRDLNTTNFR